MLEKKDKSLGELFNELTYKLRTLFRQEMELFRIEMLEKATKAMKDVAAAGAGVILMFFGALTLIAAIVLAAAAFMPAWLAALLTALVFLTTGFVLVQKGRKDLVHMKMVPEKSAASIKETAKWVQTLR